MASIEITGIDQLMRKLDSMERVNDVLTPPMQRAVLRLQRDMANYPPPPPPIQGPQFRPIRFTTRGGQSVSFVARSRQQYRRTGTLGRRWTRRVTRSGNGLSGRIGNNTSYGPFVQSQQFQAVVHRGRWQTDAQVVERNRARIVADFEQAIQRALDE